MASDKNKLYKAQALSAISVAFELGFIIALPVAVLATIGKHYDQKLHVHYLVYIAMAVALISSALWLYLRLESMVVRLKRATDLNHNQSNNKAGENMAESSGKPDEKQDKKNS